MPTSTTEHTEEEVDEENADGSDSDDAEHEGNEHDGDEHDGDEHDGAENDDSSERESEDHDHQGSPHRSSRAVEHERAGAEALAFARKHAGKIAIGTAVVTVGIAMLAVAALASSRPRGAIRRGPVGRVYAAVRPRQSGLSRMLEIAGWFATVLSFKPVRRALAGWLRDFSKSGAH